MEILKKIFIWCGIVGAAAFLVFQVQVFTKEYSELNAKTAILSKSDVEKNQ
jgi:hypothetical protein